MNTTPLKNFAIQSRNLLRQGVLDRILTLGFDRAGNVIVSEPIKIQGGTVFMDKILDEEFHDAWQELKTRIAAKGIKEVCEEAAYTWFNRMVAIRIMQKNHFIEPVMEYVNSESRMPVIVAQARAGRLTMPLSAHNREKLDNLLADPTQIDAQFALLIAAFCESDPVIYNCFGGIEKYISLLLPDNILASGGFVDLLNNTTFITQEDYEKSELIGWLYQFYISEKKDEVFASKEKVAKEDIPAATQIFTPNWIVKYMVQNTIGRIYMDNNPYSTLEEKMQYLVKPTEPTPEDAILRIDDIKEYKLIDPACGSGHILNEGFDLLYEMYMEEFYSPRMAIESIFRNNLIGIDLDTRAKQLASFALLMKAAQKDRTFLDAKVMPRVLDMPEPFSYPAGVEEFLPHYFLGGSREAIKETAEAFKLIEQAQNLGSIMKFEISDATRHLIATRTEEWKKSEFIPEVISQAIPSMEVILALTDKYTSVVANPPYMGGGNMNAELSKYVKSNYEEGKADLATVFVQMMAEISAKNGTYAFIIPPSWMFLSTFEELRKNIIENNTILSLLHLSRGVFGADFGASSAVIHNAANKEARGTYFRLVERTFQEFEQSHLRMLFEQTLANHDFKYRFKDYTKEVTELPYSEDGNRIYYPNVSQHDFEKIPGCPIGYWVSKNMLVLLASKHTIASSFPVGSGLSTSDNNRFLRFLWEPSGNNISKSSKDNCKWFLFQKGGEYRKWYGNLEYVVNWQNDGEEIKYWVTHNPKDPNTTSWSRRIFNTDLYLRTGLTWSVICSNNISFRLSTSNSMISNAAGGIFGFENDNSTLYALAGAINSIVWREIFKILNPTINYSSGIIQKAPLPKLTTGIQSIVEENISISKQDWDAHETSWDFQRSPLLDVEPTDGESTHPESLKWRVAQYKRKWEALFNQLHANEEELNRQFIEIYGLQDELRPEVPMDEITILQQGEIWFAPCPGCDNMYGAAIEWNDDVLIKQLLSYAIGCWMGRYRLDKPGLHIAHPNPTDEEVCSYDVNGFKFGIDDDGIIPLMEHQNPFEDDNALQKIVNFVKMVFGESTLTENLNFVEHSLRKSIEAYLMKDFWKDHKKMYQNRPIYWLFSSKKGAFQVLVYMHRMNPYTAEKVRTKYLLPYIDFLQTKIQHDRDRGADLSTIERKNLSKMEIALEECLEYHDRLHKVADQRIGFDLDDGVVVNYAKFGDVLAKIK